MKIVFAICTTLIILTVSCKKSNDQMNTSTVNDTAKPPVVNVDTSTLLKSQLIYYNYSGAAFLDSVLNQWTYDDQRRITQMTYTSYNEFDTTRYSYLNDRYIETFDGYMNGSLKKISNTVYYPGLGNRVDSILEISTGYGIATGNNSSYATYFYYNQENQDSLEMRFSPIQGARSLKDSINYFYTGGNLDSATIWMEFEDVGGKINYEEYVDYFSNGNLTSQSHYRNDVLTYVRNYTFTNIPTGRLYNAETQSILSELPNYRMTNLISAFDNNSYTYEQDAANRITTMTISYSGVLLQKDVFTYY